MGTGLGNSPRGMIGHIRGVPRHQMVQSREFPAIMQLPWLPPGSLSPFSYFFPIGHGPYGVTIPYGSWVVYLLYDTLYDP